MFDARPFQTYHYQSGPHPSIHHRETRLRNIVFTLQYVPFTETWNSLIFPIDYDFSTIVYIHTQLPLLPVLLRTFSSKLIV